MAASFVARFTLFVCCFPVAVSQSNLLLLKTIKRTVSADQRQFALSVDFDAVVKPGAVWSGYDDSWKTVILPGSSLTWDDSQRTGTASLAVSSDMYSVELKLGDLGSHVFSLSFNLDGLQDLTQDIDLLSSTVLPGTDIAYTAGQTAQVEIKTVAGRGKGVRFDDDAEMYLMGRYLNASTGKVVETEGGPPFVQTDLVKTGGMVTRTFVFPTDQYPVNGYCRGSLMGFPDGAGAAIAWMEEEIRLVVHEDSIAGPFPNDFVLVDLGEGARRGCVHGDYCQLDCVGHGNNLQALYVSKTNEKGEMSPVSVDVDRSQDYTLSASVPINTTTEFSGTYSCRAVLQDGVSEDVAVVTLLKFQEAAAIKMLQSKQDNGLVKVKCIASGSKPLAVTLSWSWRGELVVGEDSVVDYKPTVSTGGTVVMATATLRPPLSKTYVMCRAANLASEVTRGKSID